MRQLLRSAPAAIAVAGPVLAADVPIATAQRDATLPATKFYIGGGGYGSLTTVIDSLTTALLK